MLDFGIAKLIDPELVAVDGDPTGPAQRMLSPQYASPEQVRGESMTTATDIYSLGVLLYELVSGSRPYQLPRDFRSADIYPKSKRPRLLKASGKLGSKSMAWSNNS